MPVFDIYNLVRKAISASLQLLFSPLGFIVAAWSVFAFWFVEIKGVFIGIDFSQLSGLFSYWTDFTVDALWAIADTPLSQLIAYCLSLDVLVDFVDYAFNFAQFFIIGVIKFACYVIPSFIIWCVWSAGRRFVKDMVS